MTSEEPPARRVLRFASPEEALADARRIAAAERAGRLRRTGQWTAGQVFGHLASWIGYGFEGYPFEAPAEMAARALARKTRALEDGLMAGVRIPGVEGGTAGTEALSLEEGLSRLERAWARLAKETPGRAHPFFGALTREEWLMLHLRHSELHQSYLHPEAPGATERA